MQPVASDCSVYVHCLSDYKPMCLVCLAFVWAGLEVKTDAGQLLSRQHQVLPVLMSDGQWLTSTDTSLTVTVSTTTACQL